MNRTLIKSIGLLLLLVVSMHLTGCAGSVSQRAKSLDTITRAYEKHLRWGKFEEARAFRKGPQEYLTDHERRRLQNIRVTGYDMLNSSLSEDQSTAILMVRIRYFHDEYAIEKTFIDQQKWQYDENSDRWFLISAIPAFR